MPDLALDEGEIEGALSHSLEVLGRQPHGPKGRGLLGRLGREALPQSVLGDPEVPSRGRDTKKKLEPDADLRDFVEWAWWTGMRKGEIRQLTWEAFDRETWALRLHAKDAKTGKGRMLVLEGPLRAVIERRIKARRLSVPFIFHRDGAQVGDFGKAWDTACKRASLPGALFHDLRRSAVRNMVRGGVDPAVAMKVSGHRTRSIFDRYNIVSEEDLRAAMQRTAEYVSTLPTERTVSELPKAKAE